MSITARVPGEILAGARSIEVYGLEDFLEESSFLTPCCGNHIPFYVKRMVNENIDRLCLDNYNSRIISTTPSWYDTISEFIGFEEKPTFRLTLHGRSIMWHNSETGQTQHTVNKTS